MMLTGVGKEWCVRGVMHSGSSASRDSMFFPRGCIARLRVVDPSILASDSLIRAQKWAELSSQKEINLGVSLS